MQDQTAAQGSSTSRPSVREELTGPPRLNRRAQFSVVGFGLLLVVSLVIPVFADVEAMPGFSLMSAGLMVLLGFAELMDASKRRFVIAVRCGGAATTLLGFLIQVF